MTMTPAVTDAIRQINAHLGQKIRARSVGFVREYTFIPIEVVVLPNFSGLDAVHVKVAWKSATSGTWSLMSESDGVRYSDYRWYFAAEQPEQAAPRLNTQSGLAAGGMVYSTDNWTPLNQYQYHATSPLQTWQERFIRATIDEF